MELNEITITRGERKKPGEMGTRPSHGNLDGGAEVINHAVTANRLLAPNH